MSNDDSKKNDAEDQYFEALMDHAKQDEHIPECPFYKGKKSSTGATSDAYRTGWDTVFGKVQVGQA